MKLPAKGLLVILLLTGAALRLIPYLLNRSLWFDESLLALNITDKNFIRLLHPLDYNQVAPVLLLFIEKLNIVLFGNSEYSLRLFPLLCGLAGLPLMYRLTKSITGNETVALIALFIFSTSPVITRYSSEVKQYESDLFSALVLLTLTFDTVFSRKEKNRIISLAIAGSILIFLSNITVLVLFTIGIYFLLKYRSQIFKQPLFLLMPVCWMIFFGINYYCFIYKHPSRDAMITYWQNDFMPLNFFSGSTWQWIYSKFVSFFTIIYALPFLFVFIYSAILFIVKKKQAFLFFLIFPLVLHSVVSGFKLYPFEIRLILYLAAFFTPFIAIGLYDLMLLIKTRINNYVAIVFITGVLSFMPALLVRSFPFPKEEIKKSIEFIGFNKAQSQKIYVYYGSGMVIKYYDRINALPFKITDLVMGTGNRNNPEKYIDEINKLNDNSFWLLFSHVYPDNKGEEDFIIKGLTAENMIVMKEFETTGSSAYMIKRTNN